jgi:hypothetical protein
MRSKPWVRACLAHASAALIIHTFTGSLRHEAAHNTNHNEACTNLLPL